LSCIPGYLIRSKLLISGQPTPIPLDISFYK